MANQGNATPRDKVIELAVTSSAVLGTIGTSIGLYMDAEGIGVKGCQISGVDLSLTLARA